MDPTARSEPSFLGSAGRVALVDCWISRPAGFRELVYSRPLTETPSLGCCPKAMAERKAKVRAQTPMADRSIGVINYALYLHSLYTILLVLACIAVACPVEHGGRSVVHGVVVLVYVFTYSLRTRVCTEHDTYSATYFARQTYSTTYSAGIPYGGSIIVIGIGIDVSFRFHVQ